MKQAANNLGASALPRRDLMAIFAYIGRRGGSSQCVDGTFERPESYLERLAAAARMQ